MCAPAMLISFNIFNIFLKFWGFGIKVLQDYNKMLIKNTFIFNVNKLNIGKSQNFNYEIIYLSPLELRHMTFASRSYTIAMSTEG